MITLRPFEARDKDWLVDRHQTLYGEAEGFDDTFGALVDEILAEFVARHDPVRERGWVAVEGERRLGSIFCVAAGPDRPQAAKLRLFQLDPGARGKGLGRHMLLTCMGFAREAGYGEMVLSTHESHRAACALYASTGWELLESRPVRSFGVDLVEQSWRTRL
ncbi:GNAT family N-acetyltransferase [Chachezhania antarctica]|uniref:GNAT family N-acetyltransferase n=1 Tax=Chachezhania antarctica TaxID=2340860 RepID=UPI000EB4CE85|nr:GNAT family N-acetyltransferase [Chachezhania antarctica]